MLQSGQANWGENVKTVAKLGLLPLLALGAPAPLSASAPAAATAETAASQNGRTVTQLDQGWRFRFGEEADSVAQPGFDDAAWHGVSLPHSWNRIGSYGTQRNLTSDNRQGIGWYRLAWNAPAAAPGQRHYLDFGAVSKIADIWVNGVHVGRHAGAFSRFRIDVTKVWRPGQPNLIAVRADNSEPEAGKPTGETIPLSGDFFVHGGIYRQVSLITTGEAGIDLLDFGGPGVYARAENVSAQSANVRVLTRLRNRGRKSRKLDVVVALRDAKGVTVGQARSAVILKPGTAEKEVTIALASPHLWNGTSDPYLYTVTADVLERGARIDSVTQPLGVRSFRFDADNGFFLNGSHVKLHGVSRHQDKLDKGWALTPQDHVEDMALISEMGANTVRQAHYQHADEWSDAADQAGMVVWAELPYVTSPGLAGGKGSPELWANAEQQLRELIRQNWNHPAIMMWSIGNEVDSAKGFGAKQAQPLALLQRLNALAKQEDPTRPTTFADCCEDLGMIQTAGEKLAGTADLIGYNRYYGWYYPKPLEAAARLAAQMDKFHAKHPALPISISEYGAGGAISQHSDNVRAGYLNFTGRPQPEEFESFVHEQNWPVIRDRDYISASWVWAMFDFSSDLRGEGDSVDLNTKGLVTADRKERKDAFWYYKAQWSPQPTVHITSKHYLDRPYATIEVKAYTNADRASLSLNGKPIGEVRCADRICRWPNVTLRSGTNEAVVTAKVGGTPLTDSATWNGPDASKGIRIEAGDLAGHVVAGKRFGSDNFVTGGTPMVLNMGGFGGRTLMAPRKVAAANPELYDFWREGDAFSYAIPVPDGSWTVTIHTFEPRPAAGADVMMSATANGRTVLAPFNVKAAAGDALKGIERSFKVRVKGGMLNLAFAGQNGKAVVAAIEIAR